MTGVICTSPTLVDAARRQAAERPDDEHLTLIADDGTVEPLSFGALLDGAEAVARALRGRGVEPGQTVALMLPTGRDFFLSFLGTLLADAVPVPIYPPVKLDQLEDYAERQVGILRNAEARALVTVGGATHLARLLRPKVPTLRVIARGEQLVEEGRREGANSAVAVGPDDLALIQYTSGSTGDPKGVALSHANLLANVNAISEAACLQPGEVVVCWLPLYHDMGLIGCWMSSLCLGFRMVSLSPLAFVRRPKRWLQAISDYRGTLSPAPNFAYELCLRRVREPELEALDLSSWRVALSGAEPVNPDTVERFSERFGRCGFRPRALLPAYGLAENALAVTFPASGSLPRIDAVDRTALHRHGHAQPARGGKSGTLRFVSVGRPLPGNEVRLVDDRGRPVPERVEGNIQFRSPSATRGYYRNPEATAAIFTDDGWLRSGDRGYFADGDLFITGRSKDLILKAGRNVYPSEVESLTAEVEGVRKGCVVAFGVPGALTGSEDLVVVAETRVKDPEARRKLAAEIKRRVHAGIEISPDAVELVPPRTVPKTPSGKLRRAATRDRFLDGALIPKRLPAWVQVLRLAGAAAGAALGAWLWRRSHRPPEEEPEAG